MQNPILDIYNFSVSINNNNSSLQILDQVNLSVERGEIVGIVGESGSGKTMLAKAIIGILPEPARITQGHITYFNAQEQEIGLLNLSEEKLRGLRRDDWGMIFQEPGRSLNPTIGIKRQFEMLFVRNLTKISEKRIIEHLAGVGLNDPLRILSALPSQLSGGELQRVMIAMIQMKNPRFWIADEPTTALDTGTKIEIINLIKKTQRDLEGGLLYISHDLSVIRKIADRIIVMQKGKIVEKGSVTEIFNLPVHPYTKKLVQDSIVSQKVSKKNEIEGPTLVEGQNIGVTYSKSHLLTSNRSIFEGLKSVTFKIKKGRIYGIVGASGSGKTTLAKILCGLHPLSSGDLKFHGISLTKANDTEWRTIRRRIQIVFQDPFQSLPPHRTVQKILEEAVLLHNPDLKEGQLDESIAKLMDSVHLNSDKLNRFRHQLSGGECQRICIARALALQPELLICDEITSSLDVSTQSEILKLIRDLQLEKQLTILLISHNLSVVLHLADEIWVLDRGEIVEKSKASSFFQDAKSYAGKRLLEFFATS